MGKRRLCVVPSMALAVCNCMHEQMKTCMHAHEPVSLTCAYVFAHARSLIRPTFGKCKGQTNCIYTHPQSLRLVCTFTHTYTHIGACAYTIHMQCIIYWRHGVRCSGPVLRSLGPMQTVTSATWTHHGVCKDGGQTQQAGPAPTRELPPRRPLFNEIGPCAKEDFHGATARPRASVRTDSDRTRAKRPSFHSWSCAGRCLVTLPLVHNALACRCGTSTG